MSTFRFDYLSHFKLSILLAINLIHLFLACSQQSSCCGKCKSLYQSIFQDLRRKTIISSHLICDEISWVKWALFFTLPHRGTCSTKKIIVFLYKSSHSYGKIHHILHKYVNCGINLILSGTTHHVFIWIYQHYANIFHMKILKLICFWIYGVAHKSNQGAVSIRKTVLPGMAIPMLKIRRPNGRLIFNMEITIRR